ncbi:MAG: DUF262 domain-containing HNH endonuclease family protein, partial [Acidobacteriota bacterium]|nr:DUF262 domain-containing HNH endonuclease family protein [Acidobacteriota bacterium]
MSGKELGEIGFEHIGIGTALNRNRLVVPVNQREYAWQDKHVLDLFQDFSKAISQDRKTYFLGTIVLTKGKDGVPEVADGQQRLATTTILLAAIRDYLVSKNEHNLVQSVENEFLFKIVRKDNDFSPRLTLNLDDNSYFKNRILSKPNSPDRDIEPTRTSHHKIEKAAKLAAKHVEDILKPQSESNKISTLNDWLDFIEHNAKVILLKVPDELDAFVMFETLNDRGLKTSQIDLVKNYLFGEAGDRLTEAQQKWTKMTGTLDSIDDDDIAFSYLKHLLSAMYEMTRDREIFERIRSKVKGKGETIRFLDTLAERASDYVAILNPEHSKWNTYDQNIRKSVRTMNDLQAMPLRHLMLSVALMFEPSEAVKAFRLFISWAIRFLIVDSRRGGSLEESYAEQSKQIYDSKITTTKELADALVKVIPSDSQFEAEFALAQISKTKLARYLLRSLELKEKGSSEPEFVPNEETIINLEHILPENPNDDWNHLDA